MVRGSHCGVAVGVNFYAAEFAGDDRLSGECGGRELEQFGLRSGTAFADHEHEPSGDVGAVDRAGEIARGL